MESENPWNVGRPSQRPSDIITLVSPMRRHACMTLCSEPGGIIPGGGGSGLSLNRSRTATSAPSAFT
jgi:hypothetical protein